jgi:pimeloyl-ACP methyl ester carboxylesterase
MPICKINDIDLYYEIHGTGKPLVLISGLSASQTTWLPVLNKLSKDHQVIIFDNRGVGKSEVPKGPYSIAQMADDTLALLDALNIEQFYLVGHSMGGAIAQQIAIKHSERIIRMMLYATSAKFNPLCMFMLTERLRLRQDNLDLKEIYRQTVLPWIFNHTFFTNEKMIESTLELMVNAPNLISIEGYASQLAACATHDTRDLLHNITVPTWVLSLREDLLTPMYEGQVLAAHIKTCRFIDLYDQAHAFHMQDPDKFITYVNRMINRFFPKKKY